MHSQHLAGLTRRTEDRLLAPGCVTEWFSPRGLGKTHVAHAIAVKQAKAGRRVLLIDRDNPRREVKRRLRRWGAEFADTFKIIGREDAPPLTDRIAWATFPVADYDIVIVDSIDASTEGVGEKDSAKPSQALASILDVARREHGPACLLLGNVIKSGSHGRGSGVLEDRSDIAYEVRDATDLKPTGTKEWWLELPPAGREAWAARAARRRRRETYRLAFVQSKFRIGEEPDPFVFEVDHTTEPWTLRDVTQELVSAGEANLARAELEQRQRVATAEEALTQLVRTRANEGEPLQTGEAEDFLTETHGFKRKAGRTLIHNGIGRAWTRSKDATRRGGARLVLLPINVTPGQSNASAAVNTGGESITKTPQCEMGFVADPINTRRRRIYVENHSKNAAILTSDSPPPTSHDRLALGDDEPAL